ncbi:tartronate-semialdehyde synthase [Inquilinus ginsengisoli]|uniref:Tartronate-semialdehyde synthase n=1 Tax=Inquilinus ginsengisoli TaxID=363840 RepID=A0ABU1JLC4_9PROT|nr:glyoxylate carboligase [Inquilinus ginsengisoli]MDR6289411.1 tartronate-semialdehyde synthase [Inquilinus ginsengisoli]
MPKMTAMEAAVHVLRSEGVEVAFGVPGAAILPFYEALKDSGIRHVLVRHEEGGTHAAEGYTRARAGAIGVCIGTSGPAGTNMITGLYSAIADSIPILCITGQAPRAKLHKEDFQAVDIAAIARPVTKWAITVMEGAQVPWVFRRAFQIMRSDRPGPVLIDLPIDVQKEIIDYDPETDAPLPVSRPAPNPSAIARAVDMLLAAEKPLIVAGGGIINAEASDLLVEFAELTGVPVVPTLMGWGTIPDDHPLNAGMAGLQTQHRYGNATFLQSDVVLGIGNRWANRHTGSTDVYTKGRKFIHVDIEPTQIGRVFCPDLGIVADAGLALEALIAEARGRKLPKHENWAGAVQERKRTMLRRTDFDNTPIKPQRAFQEINAAFGRDTRFVTAIGLYQIASGQFQKVYKPRNYIICGQAGPLGWEVSACTGAKLADPSAEVVGIVGDYSLQFLIEELAVAAQYRIPFVLVVLNNAYLGLIRQAERGYNMDYEVQLSFQNINAPEIGDYGVDHVKAAEAFGCIARRVFDPAEIAEALQWARTRSTQASLPVVLEIITERVTNIAMGPEIDKVTEFEEIVDLAPAPAREPETV